MKKERTGGITAVAIVNLVFGGISALGFPYAMVTASSILSHPMMALSVQARQLAMFTMMASTVALLSGGTAIVSGVGLLRLASWARTWTLIYAVSSIAATVVNLMMFLAIVESEPIGGSSCGLVLGSGLALIYPSVLLYLINTRKWREILAHQGGSGH